MRISKINFGSPDIKGLLNNKILLKSLEKVSEHGTSFVAGTALTMSAIVRPAAILLTPDTEKENKQYACTNSICSGLIKFAMIEAIALPVENAVKNIDNNPQKYLKLKTITNLTENGAALVQSKSYKLAAQILKLGTGFVTAIPKSMLTIALIPLLMDTIFPEKKPAHTQRPPQKHSARISFKSRFSDTTAKLIGKIIDNTYFQEFVKKHRLKEHNIAKHITAATDILLTTSFAVQTQKSKKIKENRKKALIYNNIISTAITLLGGYGIDRIIKKYTEKFIEKFAKANAGNPKLHKYIEGINILRPTIIFAGIYYAILPIFSTYLAEKIDKFIAKNDKA